VQILGVENKILKVIIGGTFDLTDLLCYAAGCIINYMLLEKHQTIF